MTTCVISLLVLVVVCAGAYAGSLTDLYNSQVVHAEYYTRSLTSSGSSSCGSKKRGVIHHAGVVVQTSDGGEWLIHKGDDYGVTWDTVITSASYMSSAWTRTKCGNVHGHTVNDFMIAGKIGCSYSLFTCNCQHAANAMWNLVTDTSC